MCVSVVQTGLKDALAECVSVISFPYMVRQCNQLDFDPNCDWLMCGPCACSPRCQGLHSVGATTCTNMYTHTSCAVVMECALSNAV